MRTITVSDTVARYIDLVKDETGYIDVIEGKGVECDDEIAISTMYDAYVKLNKIYKIVR